LGSVLEEVNEVFIVTSDQFSVNSVQYSGLILPQE